MNRLTLASTALVLACCVALAACDATTDPAAGDFATAPVAEAAAPRVEICHRPPDNPTNVRIITVGQPAIPDHLDHGDNVVGEEVCDDVDNDCDGEVDEGLQCAPLGCPNPGTCSAYEACEEGGSCGNSGVCATTAEGGSTGACVNADLACDGLADCTTSADCGDGGICAVESCCGRPVCVPAETLCQPSGAGASQPIVPQLLRGSGPTLANPDA